MGPVIVGSSCDALAAQSMSGPVCEMLIRRRTNLNTGLGFGCCVCCSVEDEVVHGRVSKLVALFCANKVEQEMETVIKVLQPGPLGIVEHKFSADEIRKANAAVSKAVANWRTNATLENNNHILKDYVLNK